MKKEKVIGLLNIKGRPENLVSLEKGRYFSSSYKFFKEWMERNKDVNENQINPLERVGIYYMVFSMLEDRLETFWWNCCYVHGWEVIIPKGEKEKRSELREMGQKPPPTITRVPPTKKQWKRRDIPKGVTRTTGKFR